MNTILALDIAGSTGWALAVRGQPILFGSWDLGGTDRGLYFGRLERRISDKMAQHSAHVMAVERPISLRHDTLNTRWRLIGGVVVAEMVARDFNCEFVDVAAATWRKSFGLVGVKGRVALKAASIKIARLQGFAVENDDEADAIGLLLHVAGLRWRAPLVKSADGPLFA